MTDPTPPPLAITVTGTVPAGDLGVVSSHEHVLIDLRRWLEVPDEDPPVTLRKLGWHLRDPIFRGSDNNVLDDADLAINELRAFKEAGGGTIVDLTSTGLKPQPERLREISLASGVKIIIGCGFYRYLSHTPATKSATVSDLTDYMMREIRFGVGGTGVKPGIIGEIGTSDVIWDSEKRVLVAAANAHTASGLAINLHLDPYARNGHEALNILESAGTDLSRVVVSHLDHVPIDQAYLIDLAKRGVTIEYDGFGCEWYVDSRSTWYPRDIERVGSICEMFDRGFGSQVVVGMDTCRKIQLLEYGGWGYEHLPRNVLPLMRQLGLGDADVDRIIRGNPQRLLTVELER